MRANAAPRQLWMPYPNPRARLGVRSMSNTSGIVVEPFVPGGRTGDRYGMEAGRDGHAPYVDGRTE